MKYNAALVLEGGGMRSCYTAGVLDFFMEENIDFSYIVGVSAGCGCALNFISKQIGRACDLSVEYGNDKRVVGINNLLKNKGYFNLEAIYYELDKVVYFDYEKFYASDSRFLVGCFNLEKGVVEYFEKDDLKKSLAPLIASSSLPLISKKVKIGNNHYLDGGIVDSIPLNKALKDNMEKRVVILTNPKEYVRKPESSIPLVKLLYFKYKHLISALKNRHIVYNEMMKKVNEMEDNKELFVIRPTKPLSVSRYSKDKETLLEAYNQGREDASKQLKALIKYLSE